MNIFADLLSQYLLAEFVLVDKVTESIHRHKVAGSFQRRTLARRFPVKRIVNYFIKANHFELGEHVEPQNLSWHLQSLILATILPKLLL